MEIYTNHTNNSKNGLEEKDYPPLDALDFKLQAFLIGLYSITALLAFTGNVAVVVILTIRKRSSRELRIFLINLALSDITMAVFSIPFTYTDFMFGQWIFHPYFCPFVQFMQHCSVIVSVYTLTAIGIDRYYGVMHPLKSRLTKSRTMVIVVSIWLIGLSVSSIQLIHGKAIKFIWAGKEFYDCIEEWNDLSGKVYTALVFAMTFILPMTILTYTYTTISWKMLKHTSPGNADPARDYQQIQSKVKVVKMLAIVVLLFIICWLPIHIFNLLVYFEKDSLAANSDGEYYGFIATFFVCHWLSMANSFVNPIIYCFMSNSFRADLKQPSCVHSPKFSQEKSFVWLKPINMINLLLANSISTEENAIKPKTHLPSLRCSLIL